MGLAERSVRSIKSLLKKNKRPTQLELEELIFTINCNQQESNQGCALERVTLPKDDQALGAIFARF